MNQIVENSSSPPTATEVGPLAEELGRAMIRVIEQVRNQYRLQPADALARVEGMALPDHSHQLLAQPSELVTWFNLQILAQSDPAKGAERWEQIKAEARNELATGHRAAKSVETDDANCWQRAQFLALRAELSNEWRPTNGQERMLIDSMAQSLAVQEKWLKRMVMLDSLEQTEEPESELKAPRVSTATAIDQAAAMVDRYNRIYVRALRQLRDLRRYAPKVIVNNAGQVNFGSSQVNVAN